MKIVIERISNSEYSFAHSDEQGIKVIAKSLTFPNPNPMGASRNIEMFDKRNKVFRLGMLTDVKQHCRNKGIKYDLYDYEYDMPEVEIDDRMSGRYEHQRKAVEKFYKRRFGIIVVPTRGGKTFIASEIARIFLNTEEGNFMFCVDNTTLFNQAINDFKTFFERYGGIEIGEIKAGKIDTSKRITVAMIQTLQATMNKSRCADRKKQKELEKYLKTLKFLCVDEVHDNCSDGKLKIYKKCKSLEFQLCLSATPYRSNAFLQNLKLQAWSGDIVYRISEETLRERKVLSDYKVIELLVDHNEIAYEDIEEIADDYAELKKKLIFNSDARNKYLVQVIEIIQRLKLKTLVLFQGIEHGDYISQVTGLPFISGRDKDIVREKEKSAFLEREGGVLLASTIFQKGVTLPECAVLINVDGGLEAANVIQRKGRTLGTTATKDRSLIIDFIDVYDAYFSKHSESRLETYVNEIGESKVGILDTSADDCFSTLESWTRKWFRL